MKYGIQRYRSIMTIVNMKSNMINNVNRTTRLNMPAFIQNEIVFESVSFLFFIYMISYLVYHCLNVIHSQVEFYNSKEFYETKQLSDCEKRQWITKKNTILNWNGVICLAACELNIKQMFLQAF